MKVWIDQSECIGNGICAEIAPTSIVMLGSLAYVRDGDQIMAESEGNPEGAAGIVAVPATAEQDVLDAAAECPMECIFVEG
jgi:ferredoxin